MDILNGALARARRDERIVFLRALKKANAAHGFLEFPVLGAVHVAQCTIIVQPQLRLCPTTGRCNELTHTELEAAKLDDVSLGQSVTAHGWGNHEVADNEPELLRTARWRGLVHPELAIFLDEAEQWVSTRI